MNGIETTRQLKSMPQLANVPVIMFTAKSEGNVVAESLKAGARDFVVKPFDRATLIGKVEKVLRGPTTPQSDRR
jgi:DNA-binding response OmpR family regulator